MDKYGGGFATPSAASKKSYASSTSSARTPSSAFTIFSRKQPMRSAKASATPSQSTFGQTVHQTRNVNTQKEKDGEKILDPVEVYCRVRPLDNENDEKSVKIIDEKSILLTPPDNPAYWKQGTAKEQTYSFERVYNESTSQEELFQGIAKPLVQDFIEGKNALLFAYGVTGSGKTYTMSGTQVDPGIVPRSLDIIFNSIGKYRAGKYVFKSDKMNGFDIQSKAEAMLQRQINLPNLASKTPKQFRNGAGSRPHTADSERGGINRCKDLTVIPIPNEDVGVAIFITYIEIYNKIVYDLLDESPIEFNSHRSAFQSKMLREDARKNIYCHTVNEVEVDSAEEALEWFNIGQRRRRIAHTALNSESSRSHSIFSIKLVQAPLNEDGDDVMTDKAYMTINQLSLVDLAGSERYGRSKATGERLREAGNINNSLMVLRKCMDCLRENQQAVESKMIPYRDSRLTFYLRNYFEGEGRVRMVLCVNPASVDYDENIHVMQFAELTQEIQVVRPSVMRIDPNTPGRRKANELYNQAKRRLVAVDDICISDDDMLDIPKSDINLVFNLGPALPLCKMTSPDEAELLLNLRRALEVRVRNRRDLQAAKLEKRNYFRSQLSRLERKVETMVNENDSLKVKLNSLSDDKESTEEVLRKVQFEKTELELRCEDQDRQLQMMQDELDNCRMELRQKEVVHIKEQERLKSDLDLQRELEELKRQRKLQKEEAKLKAEYKDKEKTIRAVRKLVSVSNEDIALKRTSRSRHSAPRIESFSTSSDSDLPSLTARTESHHPVSARIGSAPVVPPSESPPQTRRGFALHNTRKFRSASSENEKWLEHAPRMPLKQPTVFQPIMKNKKSVTKLTKAEDVAVNTSKYCLRTHEHDTDGELETKLYKGDVIHTTTGGAQVVFNDVEILKQVSPTSRVSPTRKRVSAGQRTPGTYDNGNGDHEDEALTVRCTMGIGHHNPSSTKRSRQH